MLNSYAPTAYSCKHPSGARNDFKAKAIILINLLMLSFIIDYGTIYIII